MSSCTATGSTRPRRSSAATPGSTSLTSMSTTAEPPTAACRPTATGRSAASPAPSSAIRTSASRSANVDVGRWRSSTISATASAPQPDAVRRLRQILPERLSDPLHRGDGPGHARRLQQSQRPHEPVQPDRSHLEQPPRRASTRPCCSASRSAARSRATSARPAPSRRQHDADQRPDGRCRRRSSRRRRRCEQPRHEPRSRPSMCRTRSGRPTGWRSSPAFASTASISTSTTCAAPRGKFSRRDNLWSPRLGLILKPTEDLSFYASYSRSYLPQSGDQFSGLDDVPGAQARAVRQLRDRRQVGGARRPARHRRASTSSTAATRARPTPPIRRTPC